MNNKLKSISGYGSLAMGGGLQNSPVQPVVADVPASAIQLSRLFDYQSYFDSTLLERAILLQSTNDPIVDSKREQTSGYAIGLHPSSQTPISVQFDVGGQQGSGAPIILKPGQVVRPHGIPPGAKSGSFAGFRWGLPFGWLGGGLATVLVFQTPDSDVLWPGNPEIIFHRQRFAIISGAALPAAAPKNWPIRFPWTQAVTGTGSFPQKGLPILAVDPTRTILRLRVATLAAPEDVRMIYQSTQDFDLDSAGAVITTPVTALDITWGTWASFGAGDLGTQFQAQSLTDLGYKFGADDGGVVFASNAGTLIGSFIDCVRYGRLG